MVPVFPKTFAVASLSHSSQPSLLGREQGLGLIRFIALSRSTEGRFVSTRDRAKLDFRSDCRSRKRIKEKRNEQLRSPGARADFQAKRGACENLRKAGDLWEWCFVDEV